MTRHDALVIVNPTAGRGRAQRIWHHLQTEHRDLPSMCTLAPGHARTAAADAVQRGVERIVAIGGDGTLSEVAHSLVGTPVALGVVPAGSGNDFSRALGVPRSPAEAVHLALHGSTRAVDMGRVDIAGQERWFVNVAGCGFDAEVVRRTHATKRLGGTLAYLLGLLRTLSLFRPCPLRISVDGRSFSQRALSVAVANGPRYGGGMHIAPGARVDDGLFNVCVIGDVSPLQILSMLPRVYPGTHGDHPAVDMFQCRELHIEPSAAPNASCQADGELIGALPATFTVHPGALQCVTP